MMRFLYKYSPYFCNKRPGSSAVLKVKSNPFSVDVRNTKLIHWLEHLCSALDLLWDSVRDNKV